MTDSPEEPIAQLPPSDFERLQVLAQLIHARIALLSTPGHPEGSTAAEARELYVLQQLRDHWLREALEENL